MVDGDELSEAEWRKLVDEHINGLVLVRDRWIEVDTVRIQHAIESWQATEALRARGQVPFAEALGVLNAAPSGANATEPDAADAPTEQISAGPWLAEALGAMQRRLVPAEVDPGPEFHGILRPYQREGVAWLSMLMELRVGALLADDMGLGKTVQIIALMLGLRRRGETGPFLLVVPASLIGNWRDELMKFAKSVPFTVVHHEYDGESEAMSADLVITSYATMLRRPALRQRAWGLVVLDEAQTIKSSGTKVTVALKSVSSRLRIALTGTPVENHVDDLWSIMDFLNPGLLGSRTAFREHWRSSIDDPQGGGIEKIRATIRPYMLRRRKTDPGVAPDLPDKVEKTIECGLTAMQSGLYAQVLYSARARVEAVTGLDRGEEVLAIIRQLKEICGHPALHLPKCDFDAGRSAKFLRLQQICRDIAANQEKVLVFTQFARLLAPLATLLRDVFGRPGLVFDGDTMVSQRPRIVADFQDEHGPPFMILTLKAGGTGLNLTAASHVIHFDLWWNPATEAQATDRAHRIGQTRTVFVYRFVCRGTLEEGINNILQRKRAIAEDLLAPEAESLQVTKLSDDELMRMIDLDDAEPGGQPSRPTWRVVEKGVPWTSSIRMPSASVSSGLAFALAGCALKPYEPAPATGASTTTAATDAATDGQSVTSHGSPTDSANTTAALSTDTATTSDTTYGFLNQPDLSSPAECDPWAQDCPEGQKCVSYDDGGTWAGTTCVPIVPDPGQPGDPCLMLDHYLSGIDTCDKGSTCSLVYDSRTLEGHCVPNCTGSIADPVCPNPGEFCTWISDNTYSPYLCFLECDPLAPECPGEDRCIPFPYPADTFFCAPPGPGEPKPLGGQCETIADCEPGMFCWYTCARGQLCCTAFCDLTNPTCPGPNQQCIAWYQPDEGPPPFADVGVCID